MAEKKKEKKRDPLFQKAERRLYEYEETKVELRCLEYELTIAQEEYEGCKAITYNLERTGVTNTVNDSVYEELIKKEKEILDKQKKINKKKIQINKVEEALSLLDDIEKTIVDTKYFSNDRRKKNWQYVSMKTGYSDRQCMNIRNKLIEKIKGII